MTMFPEDVTPNEPKRGTGKRSDKDLLKMYDETGTDGLSEPELQRVSMLRKLERERIEIENAIYLNQKNEEVKQERKDRFRSRGRELTKTRNDQAVQQSKCSHRKGGRGMEALQSGGNAADYAVIRHLLPWNEWYQRCQRCGKTWKPVHKEDFDLTTQEGQAAFAEAQQEYKTALSWPTDNIPSTGITFKHESEGDDNKAARAFVREVTKDISLR